MTSPRARAWRCLRACPAAVLFLSLLSRTPLAVALFSRASGPEAWRATACPVETTAYSCFFQNTTHAAELDAWRETPDDGNDALRLVLQLLRGRTLRFVGDSVMSQVFQSVVCSLHDLQPDARYTVAWAYQEWLGPRNCPFGAEHCLFDTACAHYDTLNGSVCMRSALQHESKIFFAGLRSTDVVVANFGLWFGDIIPATEYDGNLQRLHDEYAALPPADRPALWWLQTSPQHFPRSPAGYYDAANKREYADRYRRAVSPLRACLCVTPMCAAGATTRGCWARPTRASHTRASRPPPSTTCATTRRTRSSRGKGCWSWSCGTGWPGRRGRTSSTRAAWTSGARSTARTGACPAP